MSSIAFLHDTLLGYSAIFLCVGLGLLFLHRTAGGEIGVGLWSAAFFLNGIGFLLWFGVGLFHRYLLLTLADAFHMAGVLTLLLGVYRFTGRRVGSWILVALAAFAASWAGIMFLVRGPHVVASYLYFGIRPLLFIPAGVMILRLDPEELLVGRRLAGWGSIAWGVYALFFPFLARHSAGFPLAFLFLVGLQLLMALGLVMLVVDRSRLHTEKVEDHAERLERLLPMCSYCRRIRDENGNWLSVESYVIDRMNADFSHGICPDCVETYFPELNLRHKIS